MNNSELDQKLKAARGPALEPDYVADFPRLVLAALRPAPRETVHPRRAWPARLAWGLAGAVCLVMVFAAGHWHGRRTADQDILASSKVISETLGMFPNRVRAIVQDGQGVNLVLSNDADVPDSPPIYVRICDGQHCSSLVTFSGQEIQIAGQKITVLSDANGGIILEGNSFAWSSLGGGEMARGLKVQARFVPSRML